MSRLVTKKNKEEKLSRLVAKKDIAKKRMTKTLQFAMLILIIIGISFHPNKVKASEPEAKNVTKNGMKNIHSEPSNPEYRYSEIATTQLANHKADFHTITTDLESQYSITMDYSYGYNFYAKYGRQIPIFAQLQNNGNDFHGWLEVSIPLAPKGNVYRKEIKLPAGENAKISMLIPLVDGYGQIDIKLVDEDYNIVLESTNYIKLGNYEKILYAGVLSESPDELEYLDNLAIKTFLLNSDTFPEEKGYLDVFDILIINDFDTSLLNDDQINTIYKWILDGGSLIIGTGEKANKVVPPLADKFNIGTINEATFSPSNLDLIDAPITNHIDEDYLENIKLMILRLEEERNLLRSHIIERNDNLSTFNNPLIPMEELSSEDWPSINISELTIPHVTKTLANLSFSTESEYSLNVTMPTDQDSDNNQDISIYQKQSLGKGNILLYNFNLSIEEDSENPTFETLIISSIINNLSNNKNIQLNNEVGGSGVPYYITNSMSYSDTENVPKVINYILILVVYILIIGPITYLILKKTDKYGLVWIVVPVTAVLFTFVVYLAGSATRVEEPFIGYVEMRTYRQSDNTPDNNKEDITNSAAIKENQNSNNNRNINNTQSINKIQDTSNNQVIVEEDVYFSLTAPYNDKYTVILDSYYPEITLMGEGSEFYSDNIHRVSMDPKKYTAAINYKDSETILEVNNNPAFEPVLFQRSNEYMGSNPIEAYIHYTGDKIEGYVTNRSNNTINNAIYVGDSFLLNIGTIDSGQTVELDNVEKYYIYEMSDIYSDEIINKVIFGDEYQISVDGLEQAMKSDVDANRKRDLLYYLVDMHMYSYPNENCIIGFSGDWQNGSFIKRISGELETYGIKPILSEVKVDYNNEDEGVKTEFVPSIAPLVGNDNMIGFGLSGSYYSNYYSSTLSDEETILEYYFHKDERVLSIEYYALSNQNPTNEYSVPFVGRIYALNLKTLKFDQIFSGNASGNKDTTLIPENSIEDYVTEDNVLTLKYEPNYTQMDSMMLLPNISYWKGDD